MKIKNKINISFLAAFILIVSLVGIIVSIYTTSVVRKNIYSYLASSNRARAEHIRTFLQENKKTAAILAVAAVYQDLLKEPVDSEQYQKIKEEVKKRLSRTIDADPQIYETLIMDVDGKIVASSNPSEEGTDKSQDSIFFGAKSGVFIKSVYFSEVINKLAYAVSAPIIDNDGTFIGVSASRYLPEEFYSVVENENGLGSTEENFLINQDKFFITPSRFLGESVILKQKNDTENANKCFEPKEVEYVKKNGYSGLNSFLGGTQIVEAVDYRNVDIIGTHAYIPETGWCLITKADKADLLSFRSLLMFILISIFLIAGLVFSLVGINISRKITDPIYELSKGVEKIKKGNFDFEVNIESKDEIGDLANSFDTMAEAVKQSQSEIEKKVEQQTKEITQKANIMADQKTAILNILEDVEKEKEKSDLLAKDLEKFKLAVDNASDHIVITDHDGIILYANQGVKRITGFSAEEVIGQKVGSKSNWGGQMELGVYKNLWQTIKEKKQVFIGELRNHRKNGDNYEVIASISPILDEKNKVVFFIGIERDITKEKEIDRAKTEFVSLASHQLRTPLSAIKWYSEMLLEGDAGKLNKEQKKYMEEVYKGNQRMVDLVNSLLNVSRLELGTFVVEPEPVDIVGLAQSAIDEQKSQIETKKIKFSQKFAKGLPQIDADPKLLRMVFQNILSNAIKYTPDKGKVGIDMRLVKKGEPVDNKKINEDSVLVKVADTGFGITKSQQDKIFTKLFRADNVRGKDTEGTGLGLYIVKAIIDHSGGEIWFESEENKGTTFYFTIPLTGMKKKEGLKAIA